MSLNGLKQLLYGLENYQGIPKREWKRKMSLMLRQGFRQWLCLGGPGVLEVVSNNGRDFLVMKISKAR